MPKKELPEPYYSLVELPFNPCDICRPKEPLKKLISACKPKIIVELGSWLGVSTCLMAALLPETGKVYAVDHWFGPKGWENRSDFAHVLPTLYQGFLSNVKHLGFCHKIVPVRMTTVEASKALNVVPDLIYVDTDHEEEDVTRDILAWHPKLAPGGVMCGDDFNIPGVRKAVLNTAMELGQLVCFDDVLWWFSGSSH